MKIKIPKEETEGTFEGWVRVNENAIRIYDKLVRIQRDVNTLEYGNTRIQSSFLIHLTDEGRSSTWLNTNHKTAKDLIETFMDDTIKYKNCVKKPYFYMKTTRWSISVWPRYERDETLNADNNWGEEE